MPLLHAPDAERSPLCGLPFTPRTRIANDPRTFIQVWGRAPLTTCSLCLAQLRSSGRYGYQFALIDNRVPTQLTP